MNDELKKQKTRELTFPLISSRVWQGKKVSNPRPTVLETVALPTELFPYRIVTEGLVGLQGLEPRTDRL